MSWFKVGLRCGAGDGCGRPAAAQSTARKAKPFLDAVRERDGNKAIQMIEQPGRGRQLRATTRARPASTSPFASANSTGSAILLNKGAEPEHRRRQRRHAADHRCPDRLRRSRRLLLGLGAKVDTANRMGETALIVAVQQRQPRVVEAAAAARAPIPTRATMRPAIRRATMRSATRATARSLKLIEAAKTPRSRSPAPSFNWPLKSSPSDGSICADSRRAARRAKSQQLGLAPGRGQRPVEAPA